jgi:RimJ/RimL family protein N-acetyltransferase
MRLEPFTLTGTHVQLQPLNRDHAPALLAAATGERSTYGYTVVPDDPSAMLAYIDGLTAGAANDSMVPFAQVRRTDDIPVGCTRFMNVTWWAARETPAEVEIGGTWLGTEAQRTLMNTEAKLLLLTHAFEQWRVFRVAICTDAANQRSRDAIARVGAHFEGVLRRHRPSTGALATPGEPRDSAMYSITDHEWPAVHHRLRSLLDG